MEPHPTISKTKPHELTRDEIRHFSYYLETHGPIGDTPYRNVAIEIVNHIFDDSSIENFESKKNELIDYYESLVPIFIEDNAAEKKFHIKFSKNFEIAVTTHMLDTSEIKPLVDSFKTKFIYLEISSFGTASLLINKYTLLLEEFLIPLTSFFTVQLRVKR